MQFKSHYGAALAATALLGAVPVQAAPSALPYPENAARTPASEQFYRCAVQILSSEVKSPNQLYVLNAGDATAQTMHLVANGRNRRTQLAYAWQAQAAAYLVVSSETAINQGVINTSSAISTGGSPALATQMRERLLVAESSPSPRARLLKQQLESCMAVK